MIYLQKASLKAVGLISRNKAMVVAGKDHLRCRNSGRQKRRRDSKARKSWKPKRKEEKKQKKNKTEIRSAKMGDTVQAPVHKDVNSCWGENTYGTSTTPASGSQRRKLEERQVSIFSHLQACKKGQLVTRKSEGRVRPRGRGLLWGGVGGDKPWVSESDYCGELRVCCS